MTASARARQAAGAEPHSSTSTVNVLTTSCTAILWDVLFSRLRKNLSSEKLLYRMCRWEGKIQSSLCYRHPVTTDRLKQALSQLLKLQMDGAHNPYLIALRTSYTKPYPTRSSNGLVWSRLHGNGTDRSQTLLSTNPERDMRSLKGGSVFGQHQQRCDTENLR